MFHHGVFDFIIDDPINDVEILNSCGGLILYHFIDKYIACNLTTKQFTTLPSRVIMTTSLDMSLAYDHPISLNYKGINVGLLHIYSSQTNSRRKNRARSPKSYQTLRTSVFFNGAIFWTLEWENRFCYFAIDSEILHSHPMTKMDVEYYYRCIREHLYLVGGSSVSESSLQLDIFQLGDDCSAWSLEDRIEINRVPCV
ncbi:hypothetical protein RND71_008335 [Anisodus tanguticus]|uniref:Uncharacterized protein n=1 Tax=Anisodus tanguticus TaxID=243964 RepID=A0AAE1SQM9_9SOLA|nr:hypothetical protein RND71_008335 [Anisodus tanguticus]